ncbi:sarcosine oxidase subunit gamma [Pikeienuella piscinae]|uniref:Sarcosine oxidase subunit gamma n=1 Tax=Pikeienuella piscinae TaxID=2748098 RepID=A0A7L5BTX1_9RHOB|nr:sarcosine oxidase subunit gamma family protein [Pikeienuella piscinae]QIE55135.1 sarcosine oxidase subunit gamma [Pikeienuella piscinae]
MSEPVTSTRDAVFAGPAATIRDMGAIGMVTIRGDLADREFGAAVESVAGCALPGVRRFQETAEGGLGWMAPDELLLVTGYAAAPGAVGALKSVLAGRHHLVADVSDARAVLRVEGLGARELIASGAPVDLSPDAFGPGDLRRTRLGQVAAAFWAGSDGAFTLICFRSLGAYVFEWLANAARSGARPGVF